MRQAGWLLTMGLLLAAGQARAKEAKTQDLPDSAFASVERGPTGQKLRHLPYRDASGKLDPARVRSALRMWKRTKWQDQSDAQPALVLLQKAKTQLCAAGKMKCGKARGARRRRSKGLAKA